MKKYLIAGAVLLTLVLATTLKLMSNKRQLDDAKKPVDRTKIAVAVNTSLAELDVLELDTQYPALVQPIEDARVFVQTSGIVDHLSIELGSKVRKGRQIGQLDTDLLEISLHDARIAYAKAKEDFERVSDLYQNKAASKVDMLNTQFNYEKLSNQVKLIEQQIANANIIAPINGIVNAHMVKAGEFVNPGTPIAAIANVFELKTTVYVNQQTVYQLTLGQEAGIFSPMFENIRYTGKITYISPVADANHNYQVDILLGKNDGMQLRAGTDVLVTFNTNSKEVLTIPKGAIMTDSDEPYVFVVDEGIAKIVTIQTGTILGDQAEVVSGLKNGDAVITTGQINLRDGSIVNIIN